MENGHSNNHNNDGSNCVETVTLNKKGNSLGLSIVAAKVREEHSFIDSVDQTHRCLSRVNRNNFKVFISKLLYRVEQQKMMDDCKQAIKFFRLINLV